MNKVSIVAAVLSLVTAGSPASAAYVADFDTVGSAGDFTEIYSQNVTSPTITEVSDGDDRLNITTTAAAATTSGATQLRFAAAPVGVEGAEVALPTGLLADDVRTEARLRLNVESRTPADDPTDEFPFTSFGLAGFDSTTNTAFYDDKLLLQISSDASRITLNRTLNNNASGTNIGVYTIPGGVEIPTPDIELQVTSDQARLLYNGEPLTADGQSSDWLALGTNLEDFDGDSLIPFVGQIRGAVLEEGDTIGSGFDNISAVNVVVPEPATLGVLSLASLSLVRRRRTA